MGVLCWPMLIAFSNCGKLVSMTIGCLTGFAAAAVADEGMWLFNAPPLKQLKEKYNFEPTPQWLEHLQKASVRFNSGGSGSFISANGLVITNHHVGADTLQKISSQEHNYLRDGFYARAQTEEIKSTDLELNVLESIEDVTARVNGSVKSGMTPDQASAARSSAIAQIEKESKERTALRSDVVTLYQGGAYHLYRYKRYDDIRLVFAPEQQIAFFGGDPDNFEFPRFDLDICIFRVYDGGKKDKDGKEIEPSKPLQVKHYLRWAKESVKENDLVFVSGHPGTTQRLNTVAHLEHLRDVQYPFDLQRIYRVEVLLSTWSEREDENRRIAREDLFGAQNSRKAYKGMLASLLDPKVMAAKKKEEARLRAFAAKDENLKGSAKAWDNVAAAIKVRDKQYKPFILVEGARGFRGRLFGIA